MITRIINKKIPWRFFSCVIKAHPEESLTQQFERKMKDPNYKKHHDEMQKKIQAIKSDPKNYPEIKLPKPTISSKEAEEQEIQNRKHSVY